MTKLKNYNTKFSFPAIINGFFIPLKNYLVIKKIYDTIFSSKDSIEHEK